MLVQDRRSTTTIKSAEPQIICHHPQRVFDPKSLNFSIWVSNNLCKIVIITCFVVSSAALFIFYNTSSTAGFLYLQSQSKATSADKALNFPHVNWRNIPSHLDSSPYAKFRSEKWIVVSVSEYPSDSIRKLVKIKGWQLLAVGNSKTPDDWLLKGSIFLSLEHQARLGFRVLGFLTYDSYVRKTVGYLFAIQHGARKIFDTDDRAEVVGDDLGKYFDVELVGEGARPEMVLQYRHDNPSVTVVNPFVHFGQRSVWPRGLPLENVGKIGHEEFYTEVLSGRQFIQQGVSNGLPDVDSVFYFTRKSSLEAFNIMFDEFAPKVALPQGIMVPVNSFNTIYHSPAFWGLMLPVSVSSMASDVLRGYWGQRILWEIGGYVAVYPPTIHRNDNIEGYPFSEEKDLHVNVGRLIKFLISWRSSKHELFEKILELSLALAEKGFWAEQDLKFTAAWLQDLIAVGYQQPRLMSFELDWPRPSIGHGDHKEFIPRQMPSVHLGVEETGMVSYEIGNLIRWKKMFGNVVLVMFCKGPVERTALEWRLLYGRIFKTVAILSEQRNEDLAVEEAHLEHIYKYMPTIFDRFTSAEGFLFLQDNTILNYWNLVRANKTKLWTTNTVSGSCSTVAVSLSTTRNSDWHTKQLELVRRVVSSMPVHFQVKYKDVMKNDQALMVCGSEIFFVPRHFVSDFTDLVNLVGDLNIHYQVALPLLFVSMSSPQDFDSALHTMLYNMKLPSSNLTLYSPEVAAVHPCNVSSEQDFIKLIRRMAAGDPLLLELV